MERSSDPYRARVHAEISIHDAIAAVEHFAASYPAERLDDFTANRLEKAARLIRQRVATDRFSAMAAADLAKRSYNQTAEK